MSDLTEFQTSDEFLKKFENLPFERQERIKAIIEFKRRGLTNATIAKLVHAGEATIYRDNELIKKLTIARVENLDIKAELGDVLNFFDEIADKAMEGHRSAIEDSEKVTYEDDGKGGKKILVKNAPDHSAAQRYLLTASTAKKQKLDSILQITTTHSTNKLLAAQTQATQIKSVADLKTQQDFDEAEKATAEQILECERKLHILRGPAIIDYADNPEQFRIDMAEHMQKMDTYLLAKAEFEKPWPRRKPRKKLDQLA